MNILKTPVLIMDRDGPDAQALVMAVARKVEMPRRCGIQHREERVLDRLRRNGPAAVISAHQVLPYDMHMRRV
jgi:hypothetical protein